MTASDKDGELAKILKQYSTDVQRGQAELGLGVAIAAANALYADKPQTDQKHWVGTKLSGHWCTCNNRKRHTSMPAPQPDVADGDTIAEIVNEVADSAWSLGLQGGSQEELHNERNNRMTPSKAEQTIRTKYISRERVEAAISQMPNKTTEDFLRRELGMEGEEPMKHK